MLELFMRTIKAFPHKGFMAAWLASAIVLAFTLVYVWSKLHEMAERKRLRND